MLLERSKYSEELLILGVIRNIRRSSRRRYSGRKGVLKDFPKITGKHLCWSLFLIKLHGSSPALVLVIEGSCFYETRIYSV